MAAGYLLGIDVGTTRTAAATCRIGARGAEPEMVNLGDRSSAVPSVLYLGGDGSGGEGIVVGAAAERRATSDPDRIAREFKRRVGDPTPFVVGGQPWTAEELSALLTQWVVDRAAQREGGQAERVAVTHPAAWGRHKQDLLADALRRHGLEVAFLAEPQAAALHYAAAERVEQGSTIAVYDFGGGTFDAAVVRKDHNGFNLLGRPEGVERLGGVDLDELVFEHVVARLPAAFDGLDEDDPGVLSAVAALRRECTEAKEALSADTEVSIPVLTPAAQGSVRLHRGEFEAMIAPHVEETVAALRRAIDSAALSVEDLTAVLLVGGSSRIPLVARLVSAGIGRPVAVDTDPKDAIAKGAALWLRSAAAVSGTATNPVKGAVSGTATNPVKGAATGAATSLVKGPETGTATRNPTRSGRGRTGRHAAPAAPATVALFGAAARGTAARAGGGVAEPSFGATERISSSAAAGPPPRPPVSDGDGAVDQGAGPGGYDDGDFAYAVPPPRRRGSAVLVGAGAAGAAVAVLAAAFLVPRSPVATVGLDEPASVVVTTTAAAPTTTTVEAPTTTTAPPTTRPTRTVPRTTAPPVTTTVVLVPTTTPPPTTTAPTPPVTTTAAPVTTTAAATSTTTAAVGDPDPDGARPAFAVP